MATNTGKLAPLPQEQVELLDGREVLEAGERFVERLFQYLEAIVPDQCARRFHEANVVEYAAPATRMSAHQGLSSALSATKSG